MIDPQVASLLGGQGSRIVWVIHTLELAEEALTECGIPKDDRDAFRWLAPPGVLACKHDDLYRHHVRELLARYKAGAKPKDMRRVTSAEILATLSHTSNVAPLNRSGYALFCKLFTEIMGPLDDAPPPAEAWEGQIDEELDRLKRREGERPGVTP